jgi:hypothetical protein
MVQRSRPRSTTSTQSRRRYTPRRASAQERTRNGVRRHGIKTTKADQAEVIAKLTDRGQRVEETGADLRELDLHVIAFNRAQGEVADCSRPRRAKQAYR